VLSVAEALERGALSGPWAARLEQVWARGAVRGLARPLAWQAPLRVVCIGGATLGGSGKTPLAVACVAELAAAGVRAALVGHAYRARPGRARVVSPDDSLAEVGDEALLAAQCLAGRAAVVVGASRREAMALAAEGSTVLVVDGVAQTTPIRAHLSLLAVDPALPWGRTGAMPPRGDLRAPRAALLGACDAVVPIGEPSTASSGGEAIGRPVWPAAIEASGARRTASHRGGVERLSWDDLRKMRVGLLSAIARPDRVAMDLAGRGVAVRTVVRARDHGPFGRAAVHACLEAERRHALDLWLATPKCALHAPHGLRGVAVLERSLSLPHPLCVRLRALAVP
jgi:tetraacyldisaccharide 4'-kinase